MHNIRNFKDLVVREDNILLEEKGKRRTYCPKCFKEYNFNNPPHQLKCCHRLCRECISEVYSEVGDTVKLTCAIDSTTQDYPKPSALVGNEENKEQYNNLNSFLEITVPVDFELFNEIFYGEDHFADDEDLQVREVFIQGEGKFTEQLRSGSVISTLQNRKGNSLNREKFVEQLKYDCECPICMMLYCRENPPLMFECENHSYKICRDSMKLFLQMAEKREENLTLDCPI